MQRHLAFVRWAYGFARSASSGEEFRPPFEIENECLGGGLSMEWGGLERALGNPVLLTILGDW